MGAHLLAVDGFGQMHGALERPVGALAEDGVDAVFEGLAETCHEQLLTLECEFEVGLIHARHLHAQLERVPEVEQVRLGSQRVTVDVPLDQRLDAVAHGDEFVEVCGGAEALDVHARECSIGCAEERYAARVWDALACVPTVAAPTASGKTAAVLLLAERWPLEVVSADAMQVYRGLAIGTASPTLEERRRVPHHLVGVVDPRTPYDVTSFVHSAEAAIEDVIARGRLPLVAGGTGFYIDALARGLPTTPKADRSRQAQLFEELDRVGLEPLLRELEAASPVDAERAQRNPRRLVRALEVLRLTGTPPSAFPRRPPRFAYTFAVALPSPEVLRERVRARIRGMISAGWLDEVRELAPDMDEWATARQVIGYEPLRRVLAGELRLEDALSGIEQATVRYAKRQRTWFRHRPAEATRWPGTFDEHVEDLAGWIESLIEAAQAASS